MSKKEPATKKQGTESKQVKHAGRHRIEMTDEMYKQVCSLCAIQCTAEEIASVLDISVDTLERRIYEREGLKFAEFFRIKRKAGFASLRRMQWEKAQSCDTTMLIWLGKQYLGQADKVVETNPNLPEAVSFEFEEIKA